MNLCSSNHEEIAHEGNSCPICSLLDEKDREIASLEDDIARLETKIEELESAS